MEHFARLREVNDKLSRREQEYDSLALDKDAFEKDIRLCKSTNEALNAEKRAL